jgi:hypothetical protein
VFIGHYAPALALRSASRAPLWALFVGVQLLDFGWDALVLAGIEHVRIVPGLTASNDLDLWDMPYTHSLAAAVLWSIGATLVARARLDTRSALVIGVSVLSHWFLDALVHVGDLTIAGDATPHVGLGLWNEPRLEIALEIGLVIAGGLFAARVRARGGVPPRPILALTGLLVLVAIVERLVPPPASVTQLVVSAFAAYVLFALAARRVDRVEARGRLSA